MKRVLLFGVVLLSYLAGYSQAVNFKINGVVRETGSKPLEGATVTLLRKADSSG